MNEARSQVGRLGMVGGMDGGANQARQRTLAERLEGANNILYSQIMRVQHFLERVNSTPRQPEGSATAEKIATTAPLSVSVEKAEHLGKMLADLADGLDRIG